MAYKAGERFGCESCGAEIVYISPCMCNQTDKKQHSMVCCNRDMKKTEAHSGSHMPTSA